MVSYKIITLNARYVSIGKNKNKDGASYLFDCVTENGKFVTNAMWVDSNDIAKVCKFNTNNLKTDKFYNISGVGKVELMRRVNMSRVSFNIITNITEHRIIKEEKKVKKNLLTCKYCKSLNVYHIKKNLYFCGGCGADFHSNRSIESSC